MAISRSFDILKSVSLKRGRRKAYAVKYDYCEL